MTTTKRLCRWTFFLFYFNVLKFSFSVTHFVYKSSLIFCFVLYTYFLSCICPYNYAVFLFIQYNTVKPNLKGSVVLLWFRDSFGLKQAKIKKRKNPDLIYLSVHQIVRFKHFRFNHVILYTHFCWKCLFASDGDLKKKLSTVCLPVLKTLLMRLIFP